MRRAVFIAVLALLPATHILSTEAAPARVELQAPAEIRGLRRADADGDGLTDLLLISGREVQIYRGRSAALPAVAPSWVVRSAGAASFCSSAISSPVQTVCLIHLPPAGRR